MEIWILSLLSLPLSNDSAEYFLCTYSLPISSKDVGINFIKLEPRNTTISRKIPLCVTMNLSHCQSVEFSVDDVDVLLIDIVW